MKERLQVVEKDKEIVNRVKDFLSNLNLCNYYDCKRSEVNCDKEDICRVKDFSISFKDNYWFRTEFHNLSAHLTNDTKRYLNYILEQLQYRSKELGITGVQRRGFGIIFNARKAGI